MIVELLRVQCGCGNQLTGLFDNHHSAIVAGERAGWLMQSESIGGDLCPRCLGREEVPWEEANPACRTMERMSAREAARRALPLTGSDAQALEGALAMTERERDEARAEVGRLKAGMTTMQHMREAANETMRRLESERDDLQRELLAVHRAWDAHAKEYGQRNPAAWDINENDAIDDADELAAYAEASDLRALAEREAGSQPVPTPNNSVPIWDLVIADMRARDQIGRARYGTPLQAQNGRDSLRDAYEEALDLSVYLKQTLVERETVTEGGGDE